MSRTVIMFVVMVLAACSRRELALTVEALAHDPQHLHALRYHCTSARARMSEMACQAVDEAYGRRFFLGLGGSAEFQALTSLPPIPASFDAPDDGIRS